MSNLEAFAWLFSKRRMDKSIIEFDVCESYNEDGRGFRGMEHYHCHGDFGRVLRGDRGIRQVVTQRE